MAGPNNPPTQEELQTLRFLDSLDGEAEAAKRDISRSWEENLRQLRGDQWRVRRSPYFLANIINNQIKRKAGFITESKPQVRVSATKIGLTKSATILYNAIRSIMDQNNTQDALYRMVYGAGGLGCGFLGSPYNPVTGDVELTNIDPRRVFIDPAIETSSKLGEAQYVRIDTVMTLADIRRRFVGRGALVKPDERFSSFPESSQRRTSQTAPSISMMPRPYRPGGTRRSGPIPRAELKEYWIRDPQINHEGDLLFPGGRHIIRAADIVLKDEANPYWDGGWPIDMFEWDVDIDHPWGIDEVQGLRRLQEAINRMGDAWVRNLLIGSNFRVIGDLDALDPDQWDKLDNEAGLVIRKKPARELRYDPPVPPDPNTPGALQGLMQLCDLLTGNADPSGPAGIQGPGSAMEGLQQARQVLIRAVSRRLESVLERLGQKLISRIFQFYTSDRVLFQQGPSRDWIAYTFRRQELLEDDEGKPRSAEERQQMFKDFRFLVTPGSSLGTTRVQRMMAMLQLRSATGVAPSVRRILQESDIGDPDEIMQEGLEELAKLPPPPPPKGRGGKK